MKIKKEDILRELIKYSNKLDIILEDTESDAKTFYADSMSCFVEIRERTDNDSRHNFFSDSELKDLEFELFFRAKKVYQISKDVIVSYYRAVFRSLYVEMGNGMSMDKKYEKKFESICNEINASLIHEEKERVLRSNEFRAFNGIYDLGLLY